MTNILTGKRFEQFVIPPTDFQLVSATAPNMASDTDIDLPEGTRALHIGTPGTLDVEIKGRRLNGFPFVQGTNPGFFTKIFGRIDSTTGNARNTAASIWAVL